MLTGYVNETHLIELRLRTQRAEQRAALLASLGPVPEPARVTPFRRRVVELPGPVAIHPDRTGAWNEGPRAA
jgi:hypothetical protein